MGAAVVVNLDLKDFFPTISYPRIKGLFQALGYSEQVATLLALLCSEPEVDAVELDHTNYYVARKMRYLPQGAPTSPAISNVICCRLDRRLAGMAQKLGFAYTRYADDMTFSSPENEKKLMPKLLWRAKQIIAAEGFALNVDKTRIMHAGRRQEVTGLVVNRKLSVNRQTIKRFRALLFQIEKDGLRGKTWGHTHGHLLEVIYGFANFIKMVDPSKGAKYVAWVRRIHQQYGYRTQTSHRLPLSKPGFRRRAAAGRPPRDRWWDITAKPAPKLVLPPAKKSKNAAKRSTGAQARPQTTADRPRTKLPFTRYILPALAIFAIFTAFKISPLLAILLAAAFFFFQTGYQVTDKGSIPL
jgi:RNA-directed DNA polymerase